MVLKSPDLNSYSCSVGWLTDSLVCNVACMNIAFSVTRSSTRNLKGRDSGELGSPGSCRPRAHVSMSVPVPTGPRTGGPVGTSMSLWTLGLVSAVTSHRTSVTKRTASVKTCVMSLPVIIEMGSLRISTIMLLAFTKVTLVLTTNSKLIGTLTLKVNFTMMPSVTDTDAQLVSRIQ